MASQPPDSLAPTVVPWREMIQAKAHGGVLGIKPGRSREPAGAKPKSRRDDSPEPCPMSTDGRWRAQRFLDGFGVLQLGGV